MNKLLFITLLTLIFSVSCVAEIKPINISDFKITNKKTKQIIALMDYRKDHDFLTKIETVGSFENNIIQYTKNTDGQDMISEIEINNPDYITSRAIGIGSRRGEVIEKYGACEVDYILDDPSDLEYTLDDIDASKYKQMFIDIFVITFKFNNDKVSKIVIKTYYPF